MQRLVVVTDAVRHALSSTDSAPVFGIERESEGLVQVLSSSPADRLFELGTVARGLGDGSGVPLLVDGQPALLTLTRPAVGEFVTELIEQADGIDARRRDLVNAVTLQDALVLLVGCGSVGTPIVSLLAQAGVGSFELYDPDTFAAPNVSRHPCDLEDLGRLKVDAVADLLRRRGARCEVQAVDICALADEALDAIVRASILVVIATDSPQAQFTVNEACVRTGTVAIAPAAYERACGGEVLLIRPGHGPCLFCATGFRAELAPEVAVRERRQAYQSADANRLVAEPGLAADIASITAVATAYALAVLDPEGSRAHLLDPAKAFALIHGGTTPRAPFDTLFQVPFDLLYARVIREDPCPVCGWTNPR